MVPGVYLCPGRPAPREPRTILLCQRCKPTLVVDGGVVAVKAREDNIHVHVYTCIYSPPQSKGTCEEEREKDIKNTNPEIKQNHKQTKTENTTASSV